MPVFGLIPPPSEQEHHSARIWAASALAALALLMLGLLILSPPPPEADLMPPALRASQLTRFEHDVRACRSALAGAGFRTEALPERRSETEGCGYRNAVELTQSVHAYSGSVATSCAAAAGLVLWERDVVAPAAARHLGQAVTRIELSGPAYACRPIVGRSDGRMSEHARANAIDVSGFTLADGTVVSVAAGWRGSPRERAFLRAVRAGACRHFKVVLSPDYNRAHADHLHFDRGRERLCR